MYFYAKFDQNIPRCSRVMSTLQDDHGPMDSHSNYSADPRVVQDSHSDKVQTKGSFNIVQTLGLCNFNPTDTSHIQGSCRTHILIIMQTQGSCNIMQT